MQKKLKALEAENAALKKKLHQYEHQPEATSPSPTKKSSEISATSKKVPVKGNGTAPKNYATELINYDLKKSVWKGEFSLGASAQSGNNDSFLINSRIKADRKGEIDRLKLRFDGEIGENEGESTAQRAKGEAQYNRFFHPRAYWLINGWLEHDGVADIEFRHSLGPGLGYIFFKEKKFKLGAEAGPAWVGQKLAGENFAHTIQMRLGNNLEWQITDNLELYQKTRFLVPFHDINDWIFTAEAGLDNKIYKSLSLRLSVINRYQNSPSVGREKNDLTLTSGIVYKY